MPRLATVGPGPRQTWVLDEGSHTVGRGADCPVRLEDPRISRHHARIEVGTDGVRVSDLDSANGLFLNGERIADGMLRPGDRLGVGPVTLALDAADPSPATLSDTEVIERGRLTAVPPAEDRRLQALYDIVEGAAGNLRVEGLAAAVLETLGRLFAYERCALAGRGRDGRLMVWASRPEGTPAPFSRTVVERVLDRGEALLFDDIQGQAPFSLGESVVGLNIRSVLCSPMVSRGKVRGLVYLDRSRAGAYGLEDLALLSSSCQVIAMAVDNARLYEDLQGRYRDQGEELRQVQRRLLETERAATLGRLARLLAHEIRNPVSVIGGMSRRLVRDCPDPGTERNVRVLLDEAERLEQLLLRVESIISLPEPRTDLRPLEETVEEAWAEAPTGEAAPAVVSHLGGRPVPHDPALTRAALRAVASSTAVRESLGAAVRLTLREADEGWSMELAGPTAPAEGEVRDFFDPFFARHPWADDIGLALAQEAMAKQEGTLRVGGEPGPLARFQLLLGNTSPPTAAD